jgi:hypothetical protein
VSDADFLSRWSRRKIEARKGEPQPPVAAPVPAEAASVSTEPQAPEQAAHALPPVESLTPESDFTPFMKSDVEPATRRAALKKLFADPQFNVMDGLDTYIADYSQPDPLPDGWLEKMNLSSLGDVFARREREEKAAEEALAAHPPTPPDVLSESAPTAPDSLDSVDGDTHRIG